MLSSRDNSRVTSDSSSSLSLRRFLRSEMRHACPTSPSTKGSIILPPRDVSHFSSFDEGSHSFPSVFSSPFTKSSLCSFLLAIPSCSQLPMGPAFSSFSTLAFLSISFSIKTRNISDSFDEQVQISPASSLAATLAAALQSFSSSEKFHTMFVKKLKKAFYRPGKLLRQHALRSSGLAMDALNGKEHISHFGSLHEAGEGNVNGLGWQCSEPNNVVSRNGLKDDAELKGLNNERKNSDHQRAEQIGSVSKYLIAGAISTIVARTFVAPLERLKLEYIVGGSKHNWATVIQGIWVAEGPGGFWKGNTLNLLRMVPFKSINFLTYDMFCKEISQRQGKEEVTNFDRLTAGAVSGAAATLMCIPLDTIRTRLIAPGGDALGGMLGCFHKMIHKEGFLSLYKGLLPALLSMVPAGAVFYGVYDILKAAYLQSPKAQREFLKCIEAEKARSCTANVMGTNDSEKMCPQMELGPVRTLVYGAIAGACSEIVTYPLEVVRRQFQLQQTPAKLGLITAFRTIIETDGFNALFSGVVPSTVQVLPSAALSYLVYEFMKSLLKIT